MSAFEIQERLNQPHAERALAQVTGLGGCEAYVERSRGRDQRRQGGIRGRGRDRNREPARSALRSAGGVSAMNTKHAHRRNEPPQDFTDAHSRQARTARPRRHPLDQDRLPGHPRREPLQRSALTQEGLTHQHSGAFAAAALTSLPEMPGGERIEILQRDIRRAEADHRALLAEFERGLQALGEAIARVKAGRGLETLNSGGQSGSHPDVRPAV